MSFARETVKIDNSIFSDSNHECVDILKLSKDYLLYWIMMILELSKYHIVTTNIVSE